MSKLLLLVLVALQTPQNIPVYPGAAKLPLRSAVRRPGTLRCCEGRNKAIRKRKRLSSAFAATVARDDGTLTAR
jgi:hypothetical protein